MSASSGFISKRRRAAIYQRDAHLCAWCRVCCSRRELTLDHVTPRKHGGTHSTRNLVTACLACNSRRGSLSLLAFARVTARFTGEATGTVLLRVLSAAETPILRRHTKHEAQRERGQLSMVLQDGAR